MTRTSAKGMLQSIAEQAGCSPSTVSRVLNGCKKGFSVKRELEERILAIANSLEYHPNPFLRVMRANDSKIIAIFDPATNSSETLHKAKAAFIGRIRQAGYLDTGKYVSLYNQESYTLPFPVAAALLFDISDTSFLAFLERREIPYVVINGISREGGAAIRHDEAQNVRTAIDYLAATGHRRIAYYYGCRQEAPSHRHFSAEQRPEFFRENLRRLKLELPPDEWALLEPAAFLKTVRKEFSADAVVCYDHARTLAILRAAAEQEVRIPQELSLLSLDDEYPLDQLPVPVAAISASPRKMGETAAELLLKLLDNRLPPEERCVKAAGRLMRRKSVISRN